MSKSRRSGLADLEDDLVVERVSLSEIAANRLRELILIGKLAPGQTLSERDLSERLRISRTPLREAIRELAADRLIEVQPNRRPRVADPSPEHIADLFEVQSALEALAGKLFIEHATDEQISEVLAMQEELCAMAEKTDPLVYFRLDMEFHTAIVRGAANEPLADSHRQYNAALFRARFLSSRQLRWRTATNNEHEEIVNAIRARDAARTEHALTMHLHSAKGNHARLVEEARLEAESTSQ